MEKLELIEDYFDNLPKILNLKKYYNNDFIINLYNNGTTQRFKIYKNSNLILLIDVTLYGLPCKIWTTNFDFITKFSTTNELLHILNYINLK